MSNIEKIRQEIENLFNEYKPVVGGVDELTGAHLILAKLMDFIDSLPGEIPPYCTGFKGDPDPPGISELEQEAARYERENRQSVLSSVDIVNAFIEGAKWMEGRR